ncbi:exopolyphosphatase [Salmonella enterica]|nr:exopolyphosphatase [Salmonella enterica]
MGQEKLYIEKELSWLAFNERVLQEAADKSNPLIERMRFLGIYSNNLDEFYKVRFAELKRRIIISEEQGSNSHSRHLLGKIQSRVLKADQEFDGLYNELLLEMARNQIFLINERQLSVNQQSWLRHYFKHYLRQHITPILINRETDLVQFLKDDYTYLAVEIIRGDTINYALLEIPSDKVPRFVNLPPETPRRRKPMILLDNILRYCLDDIFKGFFDYDALNAYSMKMTRDAEYDLVHEMESSLMELMSSSLKQRLTAEPVRFVYQRDMPAALVDVLREKLTISRYDSIVPGGRYHNFKDFINFPNVGKANLVNKPLPRLRHLWFDKEKFRNGFDAIRERDVLLYYPYHTFEHVLELLRQASFDPSVLAIKINIYRVAKDSRIIDSMIHAAHNGKKVTVVVELQARFDEEANIHWAKRLTEAGVHVIFSAPGLKIHAKLFLISRKEGDDVVRYAHIGTGNFNEKTARLYTDYSLLTADARITNEVRRVFNFIENPYRPVTFDYLMVSPQNSRRLLYEMIDREIANAQQGLPSGITLKLNNLVDKGLVDRLYAASGSGVQVNLLVRGMCSLIPQLEGISDNIRAISIVDRYLEHDRVYIFENGGDKQVWLSSADWMTRNIDYRIEVATPILDPRLKQRVHLADGLGADNKLSEEAMERGLSCLSLFAERLQGFSPSSVCIVGTHTLRQAQNAADFLKRAEKVIPYPIEIISGNEEARLIFMGVEHTQPEKGRKLVIDIGGGSTELVIGENFEPRLVESRRMGCVSFAQLYFPGGVINKENFQRARMAAAQKLETLTWQYRIQGWNVAMGASGTIKAAHEVLLALGEKDGFITPDRLDKLKSEVLKHRSFNALSLPGLSEERKAVFVPGLAILCGVFDALAIRELRLSDGALREGVLYEMEGRFRHQDVRSRTAKSLANQYNIDREQARRVLETTMQMYEQWQAQQPKLAHPQLEALLRWAAMLHEVGLNINHSGLHRHSAYILQHSDLPGFNQEQQMMMATLVRYHRKAIKLDDMPRFTLFKKKQYLPLIQLLRLGVLLNNQRQATTTPPTLRLTTDDSHWTLCFPHDWFSQNALVLLDLEKEQQYWEAVTGWRLNIEEESSPEIAA